MKLPQELEFERPDNDEKYSRAVPEYMKRLRDLYEAIHDRFGAEGLALIRQVSESYGRRIAGNLRKKGETKGVAGLTPVWSNLSLLHSTPNWSTASAVPSPGRRVLRAHPVQKSETSEYLHRRTGRARAGGHRAR